MASDVYTSLMANIALAVTPALSVFPFAIPSGDIQEHTAIPRARLSFQSRDVTIVAKIATNTTSIITTCTLPANYVYTFEYAAQKIIIPSDPADAGNFDDVAIFDFGFGDGLGARAAEMLSNGHTGVLLNAGSEKIWGVINPYTPPIFNQRSVTPIITIATNDTDAGATAEGDYSCVVSFLQYDISQVFAYPLNFPLPVSIR